MKYIVLICSFITLSFCSVFAQTSEAAIRTAIESESKAFHTNTDRAAFIAYWHITEETRMIYTGPGGNNVLTGSQMKTAVTAGQLPPADNAVNEYTNMLIKAGDTVGWASFDQKSTTPDGASSYMHEFRGMIKVDGAWKIFTSFVMEYKP